MNSNRKIFNISGKKHSASTPMNNAFHTAKVRGNYHLTPSSDTNYHKLDDFDNPNSWKIQEIDMLEGMGFSIEGNTHMGLDLPGIDDTVKYTVALHKELGHELKINERKYYFKNFNHMMKKIDEFGKLEL
jgi:hypothetical protein